jgi:hypothetical protein
MKDGGLKTRGIGRLEGTFAITRAGMPNGTSCNIEIKR